MLTTDQPTHRPTDAHEGRRREFTIQIGIIQIIQIESESVKLCMYVYVCMHAYLKSKKKHYAYFTDT